MATINHRSHNAIDGLRDYKESTDKTVSELKRKVESLEEHRSQVAVLGSQMAMMIERIGKLSEDVQHLVQTFLEKDR